MNRSIDQAIPQPGFRPTPIAVPDSEPESNFRPARYATHRFTRARPAARMCRYFLSIILITLAPALLCSGPIVRVPENCVAGGYFQIMYIGSGTGSVTTAELTGADGTVLSKNLFFTVPGEAKTGSAAIVGVPSDIDPGIYSVRLLGDNGVLVARKPIEILPREFFSETIRLDSPMSELRRTGDPRRARQSRELMQILSRTDTQAVYHVGPLANPVPGAVRTSHYGDRRRYLYTDGETDRSVHSGIDLAASFQTPVRCSGDGRIVFADERIITGNTVVIEHLPGVYSLYYHLDLLYVEKGDHVEEGQVLGLLGSTGLVTGAHLHWEIRIGGVPVDPDVMADFRLYQNDES